MEREISSGAMLGIVLLALAAVIGLGFGVFAIAKGIANEGTVGVQDSLGTVSTQVFLDYDQKVITGTQAVGALKSFEGKPYAVIINTRAMTGGQPIASAADRPTGSNAHLVTDGTTRFINYNAIIAQDAAGTAHANTIAGGGLATAGTIPGAANITLKNGVFEAPFGFLTVTGTGSVKFDTTTGGVFKSGNAEFIPSQTKFQANLLKDKSGSIMGVVLKQL